MTEGSRDCVSSLSTPPMRFLPRDQANPLHMSNLACEGAGTRGDSCASFPLEQGKPNLRGEVEEEGDRVGYVLDELQVNLKP